MTPHDRHFGKSDANEDIADELAACVSPATVIRRDEPLAKHTTLRVGGPADVYVEPASEEDLARHREILRRARRAVFRARTRLESARARRRFSRRGDLPGARRNFSQIEIDGERLRCGAGAKLKNVAVEARRNGLSGLEFLEGIPGSVGGALRMNAGAMGGATFDVVESVRFMDFDGNVRELLPTEMSVQVSRLRRC